MITLPDKFLKLKYNQLCEGIKDDILIKDMTGKAPEGYVLRDNRFMAISGECVGYGNSHLEALINCYKAHDINIDIIQ